MNPGELSMLEGRRQELLGRLKTAEASLRGSLHARGFGTIAREHLERALAHIQESLSDANGTVPPKGQSIVYFAVTGTPDGGRNNLSLKNPFTVLVNRLSPPPPVVIVTNTPSVRPIRSPRGQP